MNYHIEAVAVNHNTSRYMELMLRSLFARHTPDLNLSLTVFDNASEDDIADLQAYAVRKGVAFRASGFSLRSQNNSHGDVLRRFVLEHPNCTHYLFLDTDVCFVEHNTLLGMLAELDQTAEAFAIVPRMSWDGITELPEALRPNVYETRMHPCCVLIKNTELFRQVVNTIGLSCVKYLWANWEEYLDTCQLMTRVMRTHGFKHIISPRMIIHFFAVSYPWEPASFQQEKAQRRDMLLQTFREQNMGNML